MSMNVNECQLSLSGDPVLKEIKVSVSVENYGLRSISMEGFGRQPPVGLLDSCNVEYPDRKGLIY
jgi:hypothetical protein